jgi:hypothetical protein
MIMVMLLAGAASVAAQNASNLGPVQSIASLTSGEHAVISVTIVRFLDEDELLVSDATGRAEVYLEPWREARGILQAGQRITIFGWVDDDRFRLRHEIYAKTIVLEDGTELSFAGDRWE